MSRHLFSRLSSCLLLVGILIFLTPSVTPKAQAGSEAPAETTTETTTTTTTTTAAPGVTTKATPATPRTTPTTPSPGQTTSSTTPAPFIPFEQFFSSRPTKPSIRVKWVPLGLVVLNKLNRFGALLNSNNNKNPQQPTNGR